jgi:hypothetical protein
MKSIKKKTWITTYKINKKNIQNNTRTSKVFNTKKRKIEQIP